MYLLELFNTNQSFHKGGISNYIRFNVLQLKWTNTLVLDQRQLKNNIKGYIHKGRKRKNMWKNHTFSFIYCSTAKASASLLSSPNALINELRAKRLGVRPSVVINLNAFTASSDKPCENYAKYYQIHYLTNPLTEYELKMKFRGKKHKVHFQPNILSHSQFFMFFNGRKIKNQWFPNRN